MFGIGSVAQHVLSDGKLGEYLSVNFGWGLGVTFGVYWSYGISGKLREPIPRSFVGFTYSFC